MDGNLPGWRWAMITKVALDRLSRSLHSDVCDSDGLRDAAIHSTISGSGGRRDCATSYFNKSNFNYCNSQDLVHQTSKLLPRLSNQLLRTKFQSILKNHPPRRSMGDSRELCLHASIFYASWWCRVTPGMHFTKFS